MNPAKEVFHTLDFPTREKKKNGSYNNPELRLKFYESWVEFNDKELQIVVNHSCIWNSIQIFQKD